MAAYALVYVAADNTADFPVHLQVTDSLSWLREGFAAEELLDGPLEKGAFVKLRADMAQYRIDAFEVPLAQRRKKLLLADMDATIVEEETLDEIAAYAGLKDEIAAITARAMRGDMDFHEALRARVAMLAGLPVSVLGETLSHMTLTTGARDMVQVMRHYGATCVLVSGGFTYFTAAIAAQCGFHHNHGNRLGIDDEGGLLNGDVAAPILDKEAKKIFLSEYTTRLGIDAMETMAVGDGANDIPMLTTAGLGVGYRPKPLVKEHVQNCIDYSDHYALLYMQGYTWDDIQRALSAETKV